MIDLYVDDILNSLKNKNYFSALALALALPDICGGAEYPKEKSIGMRYINWYDKYIGKIEAPVEKEPYLSGEVVYNLRNTFLHTGSVNINSAKVKNESNKLDKFIIILGEGKIIWSSALYVESPVVTLRAFTVDATYLCQTICDCASWYYKNNKNKFEFDLNVVPQEFLLSDEYEIPEGDPFVHLVNQKLEKNGIALRFDEKSGADWEEMCKNAARKINEERIRCFIEENLKESKYKQKKDKIIEIVLKAGSKQEININLMKHFSSEDTGVIYKRLSPILKFFSPK